MGPADLSFFLVGAPGTEPDVPPGEPAAPELHDAAVPSRERPQRSACGTNGTTKGDASLFIVDDTDAGLAATGTWYPSTNLSGYWGAQSGYAGSDHRR